MNIKYVGHPGHVRQDLPNVRHGWQRPSNQMCGKEFKMSGRAQKILIITAAHAGSTPGTPCNQPIDQGAYSSPQIPPPRRARTGVSALGSQYQGRQEQFLDHNLLACFNKNISSLIRVCYKKRGLESRRSTNPVYMGCRYTRLRAKHSRKQYNEQDTTRQPTKLHRY